MVEHVVEGMRVTVTEVALALGIGQGAAKVRLHRARKKLRNLPFVMRGASE
ncbi:hypothetical protein ACNF49_40935 [Actinomadura sp. ATCC 39365]